MSGLPQTLFVLVAILAAAAHEAVGAESRPNVIFIVADDLRADAVGAFGNTVVHTPNIDRLAARGTVFTRATCSYPICNVSRSEMMSGRLMLSPEVERTAGGGLKFDPSWTLWPEQMRRAGWQTIYSGKWHVAGTPASSGFVRTVGLFSSGGAPAGTKATLMVTPTGRSVTGYTGWTFKDEQKHPVSELGVGLTPDTDRIMTDRVVEALGQSPGKPFFLQVNFTAPHDPLHWPRGRENAFDPATLTLPNNFRSAPAFDTGNVGGRDETVVPAPRTAQDVKRERALYFAQVENVDAQVGRIVRALEATGEIERTIVIFTSDHGLALGSHGLMGKQNQYEHTINVPLILAGPGISAGKRSGAQCYLRDVYPTVCDLIRVEIPASVEGRSLGPVLRGERAEIHDAVFGYFTDTQRMVRRRDGWKLIWYPQIGKHELFQVLEDPDELRDRSGERDQQARLRDMKIELSEWQQKNRDPLLKANRPGMFLVR